MTEELSELEIKILKDIRKADLTDTERRTLLRQIKKPAIERHNVKRTDYKTNKLRVGVTGDWHYGSKDFRPDVFEDTVKIFNQKSVDVIYHTGDIIEGMSNREGHIYELDVVGVTKQAEGVADLLNQYNKQIYAILGNHDLWSVKKSNQGVDITGTLEDRVKNLEILGHYSADIELNDNVVVRLSHEGTSAYALSYSAQKRINALSGGEKPNIIFNGHLHKALYLFYRNIHSFESGTLQAQSDFMRMKGAPAMVGFWVVDINYNKDGVKKITPTLYPYY